jgi:hypothetical protein
MSEAGAAAKQPLEAGRSRFWRSAAEVLAFLGPIGLLTGVLYYFGFVSAKAFYSYFGVSLSALDFSTTDYLVRSADTLFRPLATLLIILVVVLVAHHVLGPTPELAGPRWVRGVMLSFCAISIVLAAIGILGLYGEPRGVWSPLSLAAAVLILEYGLWTASRHGALPAKIELLIHPGADLRRGLIAALAVVATFWAVTDIADERGRATARLVEKSLPLQPQAVVYSEKDLHLPVPDAAVTPLDGDETAYRFRYNGLRPLIYARGRWFLLPVGWTHDNGSTVIVLQDDPSRVRVDLAPSSPGRQL